MEASIEVELTNQLIIGYSSLHGSNLSSRAAFIDPAAHGSGAVYG